MHRKGQFGFIKALAVIGFVAIIWAIGISKGINNMANVAIDSGNLNGGESFLIANMNLWIFLILILAAFAAVYFGRSSE